MADNMDNAPKRGSTLLCLGWLGAVVIVLIALGGLVLARDLQISRQTDTCSIRRISGRW